MNARMPVMAKITLWLGIIFSILIFIQLRASPIVLVISAPFIILMIRLKKNGDFQKAFVYALPFLICHVFYCWGLTGLSDQVTGICINGNYSFTCV
jgi:TctA family transporter